MRIAMAALSVSLLLGCGDDDPSNPIDAPTTDDGGDDGGQDGPVPDAPPLPACSAPVSGSTVTTRMIGSVSGAAMLATSPAGDPRLFVIEKNGRIRIFKDEVLVDAPFLDLSTDAEPPGPVYLGDENGLLGLAFHPQYAANGRFFVYYTEDAPGNAQKNVVARCEVSAGNPDIADLSTCTDVLVIDDFASNHNGGMIEFGSDGLLYIGTGDGGGGGDPQRTAQNPNSLLGKILRIDVDAAAGGAQYGIPAGNPYAGDGGAPEVFMRGLRNPWRWSFDRETGDMWIGDVGQRRFEELNVLTPAQQSGANLGWSVYEGDECCLGAPLSCDQGGNQAACEPAGLFFPQDTRTHADGWISIIAGQTYRGTCYPDLVGWHFYSDYGKGGLVKARRMADGELEIVDLPGNFPRNPAGIHADARGELYITTTNGSVHHIEATP